MNVSTGIGIIVFACPKLGVCPVECIMAQPRQLIFLSHSAGLRPLAITRTIYGGLKDNQMTVSATVQLATLMARSESADCQAQATSLSAQARQARPNVLFLHHQLNVLLSPSTHNVPCYDQ